MSSACLTKAHEPAEVHLDTGGAQTGGHVSLQRLAGNKLVVSTRGGDADIAVCYGSTLQLDTSGGAVSVTQMNCTEPGTTVQSHGGTVTLHGVDGSIEIMTAGGSADIQVNLDCLKVRGSATLARAKASPASRMIWYRLCIGARGHGCDFPVS
jgi:DUF4097 and DUF4098 domain-containing protein YvlB